MTIDIQTTIQLNNGQQMPLFGLGVFQAAEGPTVENAVTWALEAGYRSIDTAALYGNERGVGQAIRRSSVAREEIFVTTKVWNSHQGYERTLSAFETSFNKLDLDYIDLYLVHWPVKGKYKDTYRALETLYQSGRVKAIGVSNFLQHHLEDLLSSANIIPAVNQIECHPRLQQPALLTFCQEQGIAVEAWSPMMRGRVLQIPELVEIGEQYGKTAVQVSLRWLVQKSIITIPKSEKQARIHSNADIFDFALSESDMAQIDQLDQHIRVGPDPDNFNF